MLFKHVNLFALFLGKILCSTIRAILVLLL